MYTASLSASAMDSESMAQSAGLYLARSLRTLVDVDPGNAKPNTHIPAPSLLRTLLSAELFTLKSSHY